MGQCVLHQSERENMSYMSMDCLSSPKSPEAGVSSRTTDSLMASLTMAPRKPFGHVRLTNFLHELSEWTKGEFMMSSNRVFGYTVRLSTLFKLKLNHTIKIFVLYFYTAGSGYSPDHMTSWNTPQRITWTSTKAGQTSYPFNSPPEEDIEVEEVPAVSHSGDESLTDTRRNNSIAYMMTFAVKSGSL